LGGDEDGAGVEIYHEVPGVDGGIVDGRAGTEAADCVGQYVDAAEMFLGCVNDLVHFDDVGYVGAADHEAALIFDEIGKNPVQNIFMPVDEG